jgi:hypothetical protein
LDLKPEPDPVSDHHPNWMSELTLALPPSFVSPVVETQALTMRSLSSIDQLTLAELITSERDAQDAGR